MLEALQSIWLILCVLIGGARARDTAAQAMGSRRGSYGAAQASRFDRLPTRRGAYRQPLTHTARVSGPRPPPPASPPASPTPLPALCHSSPRLGFNVNLRFTLALAFPASCPLHSHPHSHPHLHPTLSRHPSLALSPSSCPLALSPSRPLALSPSRPLALLPLPSPSLATSPSPPPTTSCT